MTDRGAIAAVLGRAEYVLLTTFRRDGRSVATPVWLAPDGDRFVLVTGSAAGKVKRLRHTGRVLLAPCTSRGRRLGVDVEATARVVDLDDRVRGALLAKYGWKFRAFGLLESLAARRRPGAAEGVGVEVRLPPAAVEGTDRPG